jgi:hypothetical protein
MGILKSHADYHDRLRTHLSLNKDAPIHRAGSIVAIAMLCDFHHHYVRI